MLLFDLDGTLIDSNGIWEQIDLDFLSKKGLVPTEEYTHTVGHSIFPVAAQFTKDYFQMDMTTSEIMNQWLEMGRAAYQHVEMKLGAAAFLAECARQGHEMALLTACAPSLCQIALERHRIGHWFRDMIFAEEFGLEKRNPEIYRMAIKRLGVQAKDCVFYEDAPANCKAAKTLGITVVGVYDTFYKKYKNEMVETCDHYITDFRELLEEAAPTPIS